MRLAPDDQRGEQQLADRAEGDRGAEAAVAIIGDRIEIDDKARYRDRCSRGIAAGARAAARMPAERSSSSGVARSRILPWRSGSGREGFERRDAGGKSRFHVEKAAARQIVADSKSASAAAFSPVRRSRSMVDAAAGPPDRRQGQRARHSHRTARCRNGRRG